ncbi:hypothetical protein MPSEU_001089300 [Mayamaea pseudoterrestris]|nr:hypothetical protein MPSEU_001089300 [Mayamaea pseudoterrestris]
MATFESNGAADSGSSSADYVIIGAGPSCMGLLYGLLSNYIKNDCVPFSITVIDPGIGNDSLDHDNDPVQQQPHRWFRAALDCAGLIHSGVANNHRIIDVPIGHGRGGTSRINATLCIPPRRQDFEDWPEPWKTNIMSSVRTIQQTLYDNNSLHVHTSSLHESQELLPNPYVPTKVDPLPWRETLYPSVAYDIPCTVHPLTLQRRNYYQGLVEPLLSKYPHLDQCITWTAGKVDRLLFEYKKVIGVEYVEPTSGLRRILHARKQVILAAGAIESPALLLSSGVGLTDDVVGKVRFSNYPGGIGRKLRDHVMLPRAILTNQVAGAVPSLNGVQSLHQLVVGDGLFQVAFMDSVVFKDILPQLVAGLFRFKMPAGIRGEFLLTKLSSLMINLIKGILAILITLPPFGYILRRHVCVVATFHMNPSPAGQVRLKRTAVAPAEKRSFRRSDYELEIDLQYAASEQNIEAMMNGWIATDTVCPSGAEVFPGPLVRHVGKSTMHRLRFQTFARSACLPYFHWCGTCAMQTEKGDEDWVVDSQLWLRNVSGLRICDASVFPTAVSAPTALTCAALGYACGALLLNDRNK